MVFHPNGRAPGTQCRYLPVIPSTKTTQAGDNYNPLRTSLINAADRVLESALAISSLNASL
jgi:hypothetical protein